MMEFLRPKVAKAEKSCVDSPDTKIQKNKEQGHAEVGKSEFNVSKSSQPNPIQSPAASSTSSSNASDTNSSLTHDPKPLSNVDKLAALKSKTAQSASPSPNHSQLGSYRQADMSPAQAKLQALKENRVQPPKSSTATTPKAQSPRLSGPK